MTLATGTRVGPYQILSMVGAGGMGEVYRAHDLRLNRDVAIKILPGSAATDPERVARFEREARAAAALSHPAICPVFDVGSHNGTPFIVSELLVGKTLRQALSGGVLSPRLAVGYATDIARGLAAAHEKGIVHRDLKPENLFVASDGRIRMLDFGIAGLMDDLASDDVTRLSPTPRLTDVGRTVGTVGYMSPEQIRGQVTDGRSDIFSLGTVLYEMLSGQKPFRGDTAADTTSAILHQEPPVFDEGSVPSVLERIVRRCLEKAPRQRFQSADDLAFSLESISGTPTGAIPATASTARRRSTPMFGLAFGLLSVFLALFVASRRPVDPPHYRFTAFATDPEPEDQSAWSPDGQSIAFSKDVDGHSQIFVRSVDSDSLVRLTNGSDDAWSPFWWPDANRVGYLAGAKVWSISRAGGEPELVQDGRILAAALAPDGQTLATWRIVGEKDGLTGSVWIASPPTAEPHKFVPSPFEVRAALEPEYLQFSPDGQQLVLSEVTENIGMTAWLLPFKDHRSGEPRQIRLKIPNQGLPPQFSWMPDSRHAVAVLRSTAAPHGGLWMTDFRTGEVTPISVGLLPETNASVSPDGMRVAFTAGGSDSDVMAMPLDGSPPRDVLASALGESSASWVPQTRRYLYVASKGGTSEIRVRTQTEHDDRVIARATSLFAGHGFGLPVASPDGQRVAYHVWGIGSPASIWISSIQGGSPTRVSPDQTGELAPEWSPDGRWLACLHSDAGLLRLAVLRVGTTQPPQVVSEPSEDLAGAPAWSPDGKWLAYISHREIRLVSPDGKAHRTVAAARADTVAWSRDNSMLFTVRYTERGTSEIVAVDVSTGEIHMLHAISTPGLSVQSRVSPGQRFTVAVDGKSFIATVLRSRMDLWILDDFASPKGWLDRFFRR